MTTAALLEVADSILYISSLLADQPRPIDRVIDYFGGAPRDVAVLVKGRQAARAVVD
jgi:hypothetical protein